LFDGTNFPAISGTMTGSGGYLKNVRFSEMTWQSDIGGFQGAFFSPKTFS
jgi:hypothetical protein